MRWFKRQADSPGATAPVAPAELAIELDPAVAQQKLAALIECAESAGGLETMVTALQEKHHLFQSMLLPEVWEKSTRESLDRLLEFVFPARRRLPQVLAGCAFDGVRDAVAALTAGTGDARARLQAFSEHFTADQPKARRAAWDFGAELLHFQDPAAYPLMARWVWDPGTVSGAVREFIRGGDALRTIDLDDRPESFEAVRRWLGEQLAAEGFYRDVVLVIDLLLAQAYADYMQAISRGMGMLGPDFGSGGNSAHLLVKLLGIDPPRRSGRTRVKQVNVH